MGAREIREFLYGAFCAELVNLKLLSNWKLIFLLHDSEFIHYYRAASQRSIFFNLHSREESFFKDKFPYSEKTNSSLFWVSHKNIAQETLKQFTTITQ